ncbi:MAG: 5-(carboxyamino)imidazole ribonucleotide mutase [Deltaproteobacteria bacterium]|nr:5-(carboxyamino)imidazole ribonucleotide mutase [Deltaproteobacteria bacterium]
MSKCVDELGKLGIPCEVRVLSAHRTPDQTAAYVKAAARKNIGVIIAAAGGAAHLAGAVAANTLLPVIGVPLAATPLAGFDALLATVQMPPGVPVATVAVGDFGAVNAAVLAAQILAGSDKNVAQRLAAHRKKK